MTLLFLHCIRLSWHLSWACAISTVQSGDMNLIILEVVSWPIVVTYGETKHVHFKEIKEREWILRDGTVDKLYESIWRPWCPEELHTLVHFPPVSKISLIKLGRKPGWSFYLILIVAKFTLLYTLSFGAKHVCPPYWIWRKCVEWICSWVILICI